MAITLRDTGTGGQSSSGTTTATAELTGVKAGDLIVVNSASDLAPTAVEDDDSNSYTEVGSLEYASYWYAVAANDQATLTITMTFGSDTGWRHRYVNAVAFNPDGGTWNLAANTQAGKSYTTTRGTSNISATEDNVVAVASPSNQNNKTISTRNIDGSSPDGTVAAYLGYGELWYTIYSSGASGIDAYFEVASSGWLELGLALFEVEAGGPTTTAAPTTVAPTTEPPTSLPPTTLPPTTLVPTTIAPTSLPPTTLPPTTLAPTTLPPTTIAPTTIAPTSIAPTTVAPTTPSPTTIAPTTVAPTTLPPTTISPTTVAPTTIAPTTLPPTTVAPTTIVPTTIAPTTIAPTSLPPTTLAPTTIVPTTLPPTEPPTTIVPTTAPPTPPPTTAPPLVGLRRGISNFGFSMRDQWRL